MHIVHLEGTPTGTALIAIRAAKGYNQRALAVAFGVDQATISRWENDRQPLPRAVWLASASAVGLKHEGAEPDADEDAPLWLLAYADPDGGFEEVCDDEGRTAVLTSGPLACTAAAALTAVGGLHAFALPVWRSYLTEGDGPDLLSLTVAVPGASPAVNDLASRLRAASFIAGVLRGRLRQLVVGEGLEAVEEVPA